MSTRFLTILGQGSNNAGNSIPGATLDFFEASATTTRADTFSDNALTIANANPVVADGSGRFGDIFLQQINYFVVYKDADGVLIDDQNPIDGTQGISGAITVDSGAPNDSLVINSSGESVGEFLVQKAGSNSISTSYKLLNVNADAGFNWQMDASNDLSLFAFDSTWSSILTVERTTGIFVFPNAADFSAAGAFFGTRNAANLLDDYEEGTFTPVFADASSGGNVATGSITGTYTKVGRQVTVMILASDIDTTGLTGTNALIIRGFPFTIGTVSVTPVFTDQVTFVDQLTGLLLSGGTFMRISNITSGGSDADLKVNALNSGVSDIFITATYFT